MPALHQAVQRIVQAIERLNALIDETPPVEQRARFGNPAFKDWFAKMKEVCFSRPGLFSLLARSMPVIWGSGVSDTRLVVSLCPSW